MPNVISRDAAIAQGLTRYYTGKPCKYGHVAERLVSNWRCVRCMHEWRLPYLRKRRRERPETMKERDRRHNQRHKNYKQEWARTAGKLAKELDKHRRRAGPAMPSWVDETEIARIYLERPKGMAVDHQIPLFGHFEGRPVCGLHVPWNLQYLSPVAHGSKSSREKRR